jgi:hypothetical protein
MAWSPIKASTRIRAHSLPKPATAYVLQLVVGSAKKHCIARHCISLSPTGREGQGEWVSPLFNSRRRVLTTRSSESRSNDHAMIFGCVSMRAGIFPAECF